ncbi:MAG: hypothetical protein AVDCRST_MAG48-1690 [uncultured Friedmanniella sp.]|uniref:Integral membrane protein n=1 Tax=uncultured Friedmanniella sp. TaxID=335381 RepID=A0A6J4KGU9_9ACTN|nr:MAG: hypothetical protein AVDCRST_MAG48-1690 [uncultured Friedmanniella sp.]
MAEPARVLLRAAGASYLASCALGAGVATGVLRTGRARWVHHALYVSTATLTAVALAAAGRERAASGWWLLPVVVPLAVVPYAGTRSRRHVVVAASAAPFYAAALAADR